MINMLDRLRHDSIPGQRNIITADLLVLPASWWRRNAKEAFSLASSELLREGCLESKNSAFVRRESPAKYR